MRDYFGEFAAQIAGEEYRCKSDDQRGDAKGSDGQTVNRFTAAMITGGAAMDEQFQRMLSQGWTVKGWIPESAWLSEFFGPPGSYKSFITLDVALAIATGLDWHGHPVKRLRVVYVPAEGQSGTLKRVKAWMVYHKVSLDELELFTILPRPCLIDEPGELEALIEALKELPGPPVGFIVIDTLARSMKGDENSTSDMGTVVNACARLSEETGHSQIALVHHTGKDEGRGPRGAIALTGATDVLISVRRPADRAAEIHCERQKDDEPPPDMSFDLVVQWTGHLNSEGDELSSLVPVYNSEAVKAKSNRPQFKGATRIAHNALDTALRNSGKPPNDAVTEHLRDEAPPDLVVLEDDWRQAAYALGISTGEPSAKKMAFKRARTALMDTEAVACFDGFYWKTVGVTKHNKT